MFSLLNKNKNLRSLTESGLLPQKVKLTEVGPRDGLQNEKLPLSTELKIKFINSLAVAGLKNIEISSFVRPEKIPQLSDAVEVFQSINQTHRNHHEMRFPCLVPNVQGLQNALKIGVTDFALFTSPSNTFNQKNINTDTAGSLVRLRELVQELKSHKSPYTLRGYLSMVFGCPYEKDVPFEKTFELIEFFLKLGVQEVSLGDTIGSATPQQVALFLTELKKRYDLKNFALHFHDTRGMAVTNVLVGLMGGIASFDSSAGGLGGCPYAVGASGNVATEDVISLMDSLGIETGVSMPKLVEASQVALQALKRESPSKFHQYYLKQGKFNE